jgi:peptide deformylase
MALLKIARMGHPILTQVAQPVDDPTSLPIRGLIDDMAQTMVDAAGIGLAAPQVYRSLRLILFFDVEQRDDAPDAPPVVLINPVVEPLGEAIEEGWEGCLSIPGLRGIVPRFAHIGYRGLTPEGKVLEREARGLHARVVQHEVDHLDGILYPLRMIDLRELAFESELKHMTAFDETAEGPPE